MYRKAYGIIETLAPLHVGAAAGVETGNLNLIFRDQFTQTGIIPGSSARGRFRADMRQNQTDQNLTNDCYGHEAEKTTKSETNNGAGTTEALVKFEYASLVWLPVFCPGQPVVYITCPRLLQRYYQITKKPSPVLPKPYQALLNPHRKILFFNLGFLENLKRSESLSDWVPEGLDYPPTNLVVVDDKDIGIIHEMALYRQSRVRLQDDQKLVDGKGFFNVEALPEKSILVFPIAVKEKENDRGFWELGLEDTHWERQGNLLKKELYFGGLESIGFGRTQVSLRGEYFQGGN